MKIKELVLFTGNIDKQRDFYSGTLELKEIKSVSCDEVSYKIGDSVLKFIQKNQATPYHFAINIYSNKEEEALLWLKERVLILKDGEYEIQNFESWNAKAIYFYDEDKNIVEFIARKNLKRNSEETFGTKSLLEISEIGLPTVSIEETYKKLNNDIGLSIYFDNFDEFCAVGDENGLFICVDQTTKKWFPVFDKAFASDFIAETVNENNSFTVKYEKGTLSITPK